MVFAVIHDQRFQDQTWIDHPGFAYLKEIYLLYGRWLEDAIHATEGIAPARRQRAAFWVRQWLDAIAPSNFFWTNPEALRRAIASHGYSVLWGLQNWLRDLAAHDVRMVEPDAFQVGRDLAATPGRVVLRNALLELIQFAPTTGRVRAVPVVLVAPWINKYYIMDLSPDNSLVRYLVDRGFTVFVTSWKNPGPDAWATTLDDYLLRGLRPALDAARAICGVPQVHATGYCLGGTALAMLLAWLNADPADRAADPVAHWTTFTTLVDFSDPGEIGAFLSESSFDFLKQRMNAAGYLDGADMATAFRLLRPNNLIWHYVMHSYLYGEELPPSDVLFWNCDTTRMPAAMHEFYLRELYLNNRLVQDDLEIGGRRLNLGAIRQPLYAVGAEQDHIAPWKQTFQLCGLTGGPARYVLATSGHILGIINPRSRHPSGATGSATPLASATPRHGGRQPKKPPAPGGRTGRAGWTNVAVPWDRRRRSAMPTIRPWKQRRGGMSWKNEGKSNREISIPWSLAFGPIRVAPRHLHPAIVAGQDPAQHEQQIRQPVQIDPR